MLMDAGAYRELITIEKNSYEPDALGNQHEVWKEFYKGYAYVNNLSGSEYWTAAQMEAEDTITFEFRWHPLLAQVTTKGFQLVFRGRKYNITSVDNVKYRNENIKIKARALENLQ